MQFCLKFSGKIIYGCLYPHVYMENTGTLKRYYYMYWQISPSVDKLNPIFRFWHLKFLHIRNVELKTFMYMGAIPQHLRRLCEADSAVHKVKPSLFHPGHQNARALSTAPLCPLDHATWSS